MQVIVGVIARSFSSFMYIAILMFVLMFIFALLGMQFFGGNFNFDEEKPRGNYDSFNIALITVFQVLTMENWQTVLFDTLRIGGSKFFPALYYVTWIFIGNFILLNLFLAILLDSFLVEEEEFGSSEEQEAAEAAARDAKMKLMLKEKERRMKKMGTSMFKGKNEIK
jgi:disulfide bond formation protein DsbB